MTFFLNKLRCVGFRDFRKKFGLDPFDEIINGEGLSLHVGEALTFVVLSHT